MMVAIRSAGAIPEVRMTVDEYLTADLPEGQRYELVDGVVRMSPKPSPGHDSILFVLQSALFEHHKRHPGEIAHVSPRASIVIPGRARVREPDLAVYRIWEGVGRGYGAWKKLAPLIAVEIVSPGQETRDFSAKRDEGMGRAGLP